jgi:hypothetical protein
VLFFFLPLVYVVYCTDIICNITTFHMLTLLTSPGSETLCTDFKGFLCRRPYLKPVHPSFLPIMSYVESFFFFSCTARNRTLCDGRFYYAIWVTVWLLIKFGVLSSFSSALWKCCSIFFLHPALLLKVWSPGDFALRMCPLPLLGQVSCQNFILAVFKFHIKCVGSTSHFSLAI